MHDLVVACAWLCSALLAVWLVLSVLPLRGAKSAWVDRLCAANFAAQALTSVVAFRYLVTLSGPGSGPLPVFVFLGAPIGLYLAWLGVRMGRERARASSA